MRKDYWRLRNSNSNEIRMLEHILEGSFWEPFSCCVLFERHLTLSGSWIWGYGSVLTNLVLDLSFMKVRDYCLAPPPIFFSRRIMWTTPKETASSKSRSPFKNLLRIKNNGAALNVVWQAEDFGVDFQMKQETLIVKSQSRRSLLVSDVSSLIL